MDHHQARTYLLSKPEAEEYFPFGPEVSVFRVKEKMFATLSIGKDTDDYWMNLKCDPQEALMLRDIFDAVIPGYHMSKVHWNTIVLNDTIPDREIERMIDNSYALIVKSLKKALRQQLELHHSKQAIYGPANL